MTKILHVLDHSLPEHDGYSFRSQSILRELMRSGLTVEAITGPKQGIANRNDEVIDGVQYRRTPVPANASTSGVAGQIRTIRLTRNRIRNYLKQSPVELIHAHSPCLNGLAAIGQGRPLIYEMRSSWEDAAVSVGTSQEGSLRYRLSRSLETQVAKRADAVVVICDGLRTELIGRGIPEDKITVVPNALSEEMFELPDESNVARIRTRYGLDDCKVIGFFGSFFEWEGVADLVRAMPAVLEVVPNARLFIAGGGRQESVLKALSSELAVDDHVIFAGRVDHDDIQACYAAADVMAYPRIPDRLTNMVTPLKPLEAMAQGTVVVASDVGGHKELIADGKTGLLFNAGSHTDLAEKIVRVLNSPDMVRDITARAMDFVKREKRWSAVVQRYLPVYDSLVNGQKR